MLIWRWTLKIADTFLGNPMRALGLVVVFVGALYHNTLAENLPNSLPEVDDWLANIAPTTVHLSGSLTGMRECWRMRATFFEEDHSKLLHHTNHIILATTRRPDVKIDLPLRDVYKLRLESMVYLSDPEKDCLRIGSGPILKSKSIVTSLHNPGDTIKIQNNCNFSSENHCSFEVQ
jgi:hypothetical protein